MAEPGPKYLEGKYSAYVNQSKHKQKLSLPWECSVYLESPNSDSFQLNVKVSQTVLRQYKQRNKVAFYVFCWTTSFSYSRDTVSIPLQFWGHSYTKLLSLMSLWNSMWESNAVTNHAAEWLWGKVGKISSSKDSQACYNAPVGSGVSLWWTLLFWGGILELPRHLYQKYLLRSWHTWRQAGSGTAHTSRLRYLGKHGDSETGRGYPNSQVHILVTGSAELPLKMLKFPPLARMPAMHLYVTRRPEQVKIPQLQPFLFYSLRTTLWKTWNRRWCSCSRMLCRTTPPPCSR